MIKKIILTATILILLSMQAVFAVDYYVDCNANDGGDGTTTATSDPGDGHYAWNDTADVVAGSPLITDTVYFKHNCIQDDYPFLPMTFIKYPDVCDSTIATCSIIP